MVLNMIEKSHDADASAKNRAYKGKCGTSREGRRPLKEKDVYTKNKNEKKWKGKERKGKKENYKTPLK